MLMEAKIQASADHPQPDKHEVSTTTGLPDQPEGVALREISSTPSRVTAHNAGPTSSPSSVTIHERPNISRVKASNHPQMLSKGKPQKPKRRPRKATRVIFRAWDRLVAFAGLAVAVLALYWVWRGTLSAEAIALKGLILECRKHYETTPSSPGAIPPECADIISAKVAPLSKRLELKDGPAKPGPFEVEGPLPSWMRAKCYNGTRALAPVHADEGTGTTTLWVESFNGCISMISLEKSGYIGVQQWTEGPLDLGARFDPGDFPYLQTGTNSAELMGCVNCEEMWGI